jgi:hypothetical protein
MNSKLNSSFIELIVTNSAKNIEVLFNNFIQEVVNISDSNNLPNIRQLELLNGSFLQKMKLQIAAMKEEIEKNIKD